MFTPENKTVVITVPIHGTLKSIDGSTRAYSVPSEYVIKLEEIATRPETFNDGTIFHASRVTFAIKCGGWLDWKDVELFDTPEFEAKRREDISQDVISAMAHDHQDEQDAKSAVGLSLSIRLSLQSRELALQALLSKCGFGF